MKVKNNIIDREDLKRKKFNGWDKRRAFIFENGNLKGIVYNESQNIKPPDSFCIYGEKNGYYTKTFSNNSMPSSPIPIFRSLGKNKIEFVGCFDVIDVQTPTNKSKCTKINGSKILIAKIELKRASGQNCMKI